MLLGAVFTAMLQADDEDDIMEMQVKTPFGSSFRTFNATDYKPIGENRLGQRRETIFSIIYSVQYSVYLGVLGK